MRIISHYMAREFLKLTLLCLAIFVFIFLLVDAMEKLDDFNEAGVAAPYIVRYFLYTLPEIVRKMVPLAILMGTQLTFGLLSRNNQLIAFKSSGLNMIRLSFPILLFSLAASILLLIMGESLVPYTNGRAAEIWNVQVKKKEPKAVLIQERIWYRGEQAIYTFNQFNFRQQSAEGVTLYFFDPQFNLSARLDALRAQWVQEAWNFSNGLYQTFGRDGSHDSQPFTEKRLSLSETPDDFLVQKKGGEELTYTQLRSYIVKVQREGYDPAPYVVEKHMRLAFPLVCVIMALIGISMALRKEKGIGIAQGIVGSLAIAFVYLVFFSFSRSLGQTGVFPPLWAAWASNLLFLMIGGYLLVTIRQ